MTGATLHEHLMEQSVGRLTVAEKSSMLEQHQLADRWTGPKVISTTRDPVQRHKEALEESQLISTAATTTSSSSSGPKEVRDYLHSTGHLTISTLVPLPKVRMVPSSQKQQAADEEGQEEGLVDYSAVEQEKEEEEGALVEQELTVEEEETASLPRGTTQVYNIHKYLQHMSNVEQMLMTDYPHGVPKGLIRQLREQGVNLPGLGHGFTCNMKGNMANALVRR